MNRAQFALVLYRYEGEPPVSGRHSFGDVEEGSIADRAITWASQNDIVTGQRGNFNPRGNMSRAQMILLMHRYSKFKGFDLSFDTEALEPYSDKGSISPTATEAMQWGVSKGLITGGGGLLRPNGDITRAQVVLILHRLNNTLAT